MPDLDKKDRLLKKAKKLWVTANVALEKGLINDYFKEADKLFRFMKDNKVEPTDLIPVLDKVYITPMSYSRLNAIFLATSEYGLGASTMEESVIETGLVSSVGKISSFFMDCKMEPNQRAEADPALLVSKRDVIVGIMSHMKDVVESETFIRGVRVKNLLENKIEAVKGLEEDDDKAFDIIFSAKHSGVVLSPETPNITFQTPISSNLNITYRNTDESSIQLDWFRAGTQNKIFVNGVALSNIAKAYNQFKSQDDVIRFFNEIILKDFTGTKEQKVQANKYLTTTFRQGGLLYPVSSALARSFLMPDGVGIIPVPARQKVNIQTSVSGFSVQELCSCAKISLRDSDNTLNLMHLANDDGIIKSEDESDELIVAEGTVSVDFSKTPEHPSLTVLSNKIEVKHADPLLAKYIDNRHWLQKFIDTLKKLLGWNNVSEIAAKKPDASIVEKIDSNIAKSKQCKTSMVDLRENTLKSHLKPTIYPITKGKH